MKQHNLVLLICLLLLLLAGCAEDFLDIKRDKKQVIPTTIADQRALLNNTTVFNFSSSLLLNIIGGEEYTVTDDVWGLLSSPMQKNAYIWSADVFEGQTSDDWNRGYSRALYANLALDGLAKIRPLANEQAEWETVKGTALFLRAYTFYQLAQTFCKPYSSQTAATDAGIPLRLDADVTLPVVRASVQDSYDAIINDLKSAIRLLPVSVETPFMPSKAAGYALLAKTFLHIGDYQQVALYADSCLSFSRALIDFNQLNTTLRYTFSSMQLGIGNPEILYFEAIPGVTIVNSSRFVLNPELYDLYEETDLRKEAYFFPTRGTYTFKGSYVGAYNFFGGLAIDEIILIRAESKARLNDISEAHSDLNYLLKNRYRSDVFKPYESNDKIELLKKIIEERRKELLCRGLRWEDLRRYNQEEEFKQTLVRGLKGKSYELEPGSSLYVWPIPDEVVNISGVAQNPR